MVERRDNDGLPGKGDASDDAPTVFEASSTVTWVTDATVAEGDGQGVHDTVECPTASDTVTVSVASGPVSRAVSAASHPVTEPRLEELSLIGRGGFGAVYAALDRTLLRTVAKKSLDPARRTDTNAVNRFVEEAQITAQLDHPNIVPVHDFAIDNEGRHYFTMKMVKGRTLGQYLRHFERGLDSRELTETLQILLKVCDAVGFAHDRGVVHRDLKPDNVMIGTFGQVYVMDWGIARLLSGERPSTSGGEAPLAPVRVTGTRMETDPQRVVIVGSFAYMSPEQAFGQEERIDQRTDVFAVGAILYQVLTGHPPFQGEDPRAVLNAARRCQVADPVSMARRRGLPGGLAQIALKAMAADPDERYQSMAEMKQAIETFMRGGFLFTTRTYAPGTELFRAGDEANAAFIIASGECEVFKREAGGDAVLRRMGPGAVFGETALLAGQNRTAGIRALSELVAVEITRESLHAELGSDNWIAALVISVVERFVAIDAEADAARERVAASEIVACALECLCREGTRDDGGFALPWPRCLAWVQARCSGDADYLRAALERDGRLRVTEAGMVVFAEEMNPASSA